MLPPLEEQVSIYMLRTCSPSEILDGVFLGPEKGCSTSENRHPAPMSA